MHKDRTKEDYMYFGHNLSSSLSSIAGTTDRLQVWGSDGEVSLVACLNQTSCFKNSIHLACMLHFKENIERKLNIFKN